MARASAFVAGMALGFALATGILVSHADPAQAEVKAAAEQAGVDVVDLQGAVNDTGMDPFVYLRGVGELPPLVPPKPPPVVVVTSTPLVDCIIRAESRGNPSAVNPRSGASGLGQFLPSTWRTTPQGKAGLSVFDPAANRAAVAWMLSVGRGGEFATLGLCR
jgi:hypothetical protein